MSLEIVQQMEYWDIVIDPAYQPADQDETAYTSQPMIALKEDFVESESDSTYWETYSTAYRFRAKDLQNIKILP